ncbi:unnamed protein product [Adineta steineri]|uniref:G-protein coupled receptors family 1 profile domain-containing protein n=1 Tax=Adineta steineri TaxID=433720 RepID=A0A815AWF4_9BILA|nr:unnamed protein product [Adineta steineri]CAF3956172.1 unnamed protein product [Adineta steineri]
MLGLVLLNGFNVNLQNSSFILCKLYFYASFLFAALSPTVLILASIDRLLISSQNVDTRLYSSKRLAYFSISISTVFWIVFNSQALIKVNLQEFAPFYFVCYFDLFSTYFDFVSYFVAVINAILDILMIIMSVFALKNVRRIRSIPREKRNQIRSMTKKDFQVLRCLFVQDVIFIIFGTLISIFYVVDAITKYQNGTILEQAIRNFLYNSMTFIYSTSYSVNVFTFIIVSKAFRHELKRTIYKIIGKDLVPIREEENRQENHERDNVEMNVVSIIELPV